jgi:hypothetical protein
MIPLASWLGPQAISRATRDFWAIAFICARTATKPRASVTFPRGCAGGKRERERERERENRSIRIEPHDSHSSERRLSDFCDIRSNG